MRNIRTLSTYWRLLAIALGLGWWLLDSTPADAQQYNVRDLGSSFPTNSYAYRNRALVNLELKQNDKACTDLEAAMKFRFTEQYGPEVKELYEQHCH